MNSGPDDCTNLKLFYEKEGLIADRYNSKNFWERRYHRKKASIVNAVLRSIFRQNDLVLDAGCGTGELSLIAQNMGGHVVSVDFTKSYLKRVPKNIENRVCASLNCLPFKTTAFDIVMCADVIEHLPECDKVLKELKQVSLRSAILTTPCQGVFRVIFGKLFPKRLEYLDKKVGHIRTFSLSGLYQKLVEQGWNVGCQSYFVIQPIPEKFLSKRLGAVVTIAEKFADAFLPGQGTISLALMIPTNPIRTESRKNSPDEKS
jgi:ubiquinone/menaquinone biosynthesis C-methylase UbiE